MLLFARTLVLGLINIILAYITCMLFKYFLDKTYKKNYDSFSLCHAQLIVMSDVTAITLVAVALSVIGTALSVDTPSNNNKKMNTLHYA